MISIVNGAVSKFIITSDESRICLLPGAEHDQLYTARVLDEVGNVIKRDPANFDTFVGILVREGEPISDFAVILRKLT